MAILVMILGDTGSGKTRSIKNMDQEKTLIIQVTDKPLPFKETGWKKVLSTNFSDVAKMLNAAVAKKLEAVIVDDFQYLLAGEFMRRGGENGYQKFTDIAVNTYNLLSMIQAMPKSMVVYLTWHSETTIVGEEHLERAKTIGKMLNEKITVEGLFTIILKAYRDKLDGKYYFATQTNGNDVCKSPEDLFESNRIENDLSVVHKAICNFYNIGATSNEV